jgi:hypothetical protein
MSANGFERLYVLGVSAAMGGQHTMDGILHRIGEIIRFRRVMQPVRAATLMAIVDGSVVPDAPFQECSPALVSALCTPTSQW